MQWGGGQARQNTFSCGAKDKVHSALGVAPVSESLEVEVPRKAHVGGHCLCEVRSKARGLVTSYRATMLRLPLSSGKPLSGWAASFLSGQCRSRAGRKLAPGVLQRSPQKPPHEGQAGRTGGRWANHRNPRSLRPRAAQHESCQMPAPTRKVTDSQESALQTEGWGQKHISERLHFYEVKHLPQGLRSLESCSGGSFQAGRAGQGRAGAIKDRVGRANPVPTQCTEACSL